MIISVQQIKEANPEIVGDVSIELIMDCIYHIVKEAHMYRQFNFRLEKNHFEPTIINHNIIVYEYRVKKDDMFWQGDLEYSYKTYLIGLNYDYNDFVQAIVRYSKLKAFV